MLPRVAFEYGQTMCAACTSFSAVSRSRPGSDTFSATWMPKPLGIGPMPTDVRVGDTIEWVNRDIFQHTATARNGLFDVEIKPKQRVRVTLDRPGEIAIYCRYHPGMTASLLVAL